MNIKHYIKRIRVMWLNRIYFHFLSVGKDLYCGFGSHIRAHSVTVGDYVYIGNHCHIASAVSIGNFVMLASYVSIVGGDHRMDIPGTPTIFSGRGENKQVVIEDDVWIGHGATIMHGVTIGEGAIIAAGAVVTKSVPPYSISAGIPAIVLRKRFDETSQQVHQEMLKKYRQTKEIVPSWQNVSKVRAKITSIDTGGDKLNIAKRQV